MSMDTNRLVTDILARMAADGMDEATSAQVFRGGAASAPRVLAEALAGGVVNEVEHHYNGTTGSDNILNNLVGGGVLYRVDGESDWELATDLLRQEDADARYSTPTQVSTAITAAITGLQPYSAELSSAASVTGFGYIKRVAYAAWTAVSSIPWADLVGIPTVTAGNGLTGGGSLVTAISLAVAFAGSGAANTVSRSDHRHDLEYVALDGSNSPMTGALESPNFIGGSPQGGNGSGLITNGAIAWYQSSRSANSRWWDMISDVVSGELRIRALDDSGSTLATPIKFSRSGNVVIGGAVTANSYSVVGGTAAGFLKANGTVDTSTYLTANQSISLTGDVIGTGATSIPTTVLKLNGQALPSFGSTAANFRWSGTAWQMDVTPYATVSSLASYATSAALSAGLAGRLPASGGSTNKVAKWTGSTTLGSGIITDDGDFVFADPGTSTGGRFKSRYAGSKAQLVGNSNAVNWWGVGTDGTTADMVRIGRTTSDGVFVADAFELFVLGNLRLPGCLFRDDVWSSDGYAMYASGVTPNNTNASLYFSKNGALSAINGSASSSLSVGGSAVATASASGLSIPSLSAGGMLRAAAGGLLQIANVSDLPGGPFLPLSAGAAKPITGILTLQNNLDILDGKAITSNGSTVLAIGSPWFGPGILFPWTASTISGIDFQVNGRSKFVGLLDPAGGIAGDTSGGNAPAQGVGECIEAAIDNTSAVTLTTGVGVDVISISVPAGDWNIFASVNGRANTSAVSRFRTAISDSSATVISDGREGDSTLPTGSGVGEHHVLMKRVNFSGPNRTYYLAAILTGTFGSGNCWGSISAQRRR